MSSLRVLIIEGDAPLRRLLVWALQQDGYRVVRVASVAEAVARAGRYKPEIVVFNVEMSDAEKFAGIARLRSAFTTMKIVDVSPEREAILTTARSQVRRKLADYARLNVPFSLDSLLDAVASLTTTGKRGRQ